MATITSALGLVGSLIGNQSSDAQTDSSSFASAYQAASTTESAAAKHKAAGEASLAEFQRYAKETPAQRMFDNWLSSQKITMDEYNAMTPAQQLALRNQFNEAMKEKLSGSAQSSVAAAT